MGTRIEGKATLGWVARETILVWNLPDLKEPALQTPAADGSRLRKCQGKGPKARISWTSLRNMKTALVAGLLWDWSSGQRPGPVGVMGLGETVGDEKSLKSVKEARRRTEA
jgi:hypothetical protein